MDRLALIVIIFAIYIAVVALGAIVYCVTSYKEKSDKLTEVLKEKEASYKERLEAVERAENDLKLRQDTLLEEENILRLEKDERSNFEKMSEKELAVTLCQKFDRNKLVVDHIYERVINVKEYSQDLKSLKEDTLNAGADVKKAMEISSEETIDNIKKTSSDLIEEMRKATKENSAEIKSTIGSIESAVGDKIKESMVSKDTMDEMMVNAVKTNVPDADTIKGIVEAAKPEPFSLDENLIKNIVREVVLEICAGEQMHGMIENAVKEAMIESNKQNLTEENKAK